MKADLVAESEIAVAGDLLPDAPPRKPGPTLAKRASLTAVASLLDYGVKAAVSLIVTPILVSGLGRSLFGVWEMLGRLGTYMSATDGRPTEALRLVVAQHQADTGHGARRRFIGASLVVWVIMLPLILAAGAILALWVAPALTNAPPALRGDVQVTVGLIVLTFMLSSLGQVPESVLRGMNLGYRRMGLQSALNILGGACAAAAVWSGFGLVGLGGAQVIRALATGIVFWMLVRKYIPWFGAERPARSEVKTLVGMSLWLSLGDAVAKLLLASDVLVLGAVVAPALVTTYALSSYAARTAIGIHVFTAGAAIPGLGGLLGRREMARAIRARRELLLLTWLFATIVGGVILLWNRSFVALWVGAEHYAGAWVDLLIVLAATQTMFIRTESYIIDANLQPRERVTVAALAAVLTISLSIALTGSFGLPGLTTGIILGRLVQTVAYPILVRRCLGTVHDRPAERGRAFQLVAVSALVFGSAAWLGNRLTAPTWPLWLAGVAASALILATIGLGLGTTREERRTLGNRARTLRARRGPS